MSKLQMMNVCNGVCIINVDYILKIFLLKSTRARGMVCFIVVLFHYHYVFFFILLNYVFLLPPWLILPDSIFLLYAVVVFVVIDIAF